MNIAFFLPSLSSKGGLERATITLINTLAEYCSKDIEVTLVTLRDECSAFPVSDKVNVSYLNINDYRKQYLLLLYKIRKFIKSNDINIFVSVETMTLLFTFIPMFTLIKRPKFVLWEHFNFKNNNNRRSRDYLRVLASKFLDLIITLTERDAETWINKLSPSAKVTYIYNISPFSNHVPFYKKDSKKAVAIGRYVSVKGFDRLIKAWALYEQKFGSNGWTLDIIGYGELAEQLKHSIILNGLKNVRLVADTKGVEYYYSNAGLYCMSSYFEGLSMVMIEAQSFAIPAVAFDIYTGNSEILEFGSGILVEDGDLEAYATAIHSLTSNINLRLSMSHKALENSTRFKDINIAKRWLKEFENLLYSY